MKRAFLLWTCGLVGWLGVHATASAGVVALWEFNEGSGTTANSSVGGWTGTLQYFGSPPPVNPTPPEPGWIVDGWQGLRFNKGTGQPYAARVETNLPIFQQLTGKSFTLEYIGSLDTISNWGPFFGQSGTTSTKIFFFGKTHPTTDPPMSIHYNLAGLGSGYSNGINNIQDGRMHHFALVFDDTADTMQFYVDYQPAGRITRVGGTLTSYSETLWFGSIGHVPAGEFWNGNVDAVRISDEALGPTQLYRYQAPAAPPPGVVAWYRFEDGSGGTARDSSGNGFHAGLRNFVSTAAGDGNTTQSGWANALVSPLTDAGTPIANTGALRLDGTRKMNEGDFVQTPVPIPTGAFTVEAIVLAEDASAGWAPVFGESMVTSDNMNIFYFGKREGSGAMHYNLYMNNPARYVSADLWNVNLADGQPHHIALMFDPNRKNIVVFFDYRAVHTRNDVTGTLEPFPGSAFRLGTRDDTHSSEKFDGQIDEARIWNIPILPYQMVGGPYQTGIPLRAYLFQDRFDSEKADWNFLQNQTSQAVPRHVMIIDEPGNPANKVLQLSSTTGDLATSAILQQRAEVRRFDAQFRFRVPTGTGAEGFTFGVFDVPYHLGTAGSYLGYYDNTGTLAGLYPSFAVEFDMYQGGTSGETNGNHVAVHRNYDINNYVGSGPSSYVPGFNMKDGNWAYVRISFDNGLISVWMNQTGFNFGPGDLVINQLDVGDVDLSGNGRFDPFFGYFGFTAGNRGLLYNQIVIDDFVLNVIPEPSSLALALVGLGSLLMLVCRRRWPMPPK